ncbi:MAG: PocR ligand-binding domain-containing protein [Lentisphaeria bacterium]|nr:PocR ligand-binding domain-containing protein [Lentisphaeria bacterium]
MKKQKSSIELILSDEVQSLLDDVAALIDARVTFFGPDGTGLRRGKEMSNSEFCRHIQSCPGGLCRCQEMDLKKQQEAAAARDVVLYRCHAGAHEIVAPVFLHGKCAGFLMIGQFRIDDELPSGTPELQEYYRKLPRFSAEKLAAITGLFRTLIDYISIRELAVLQSDQLRLDIDRYIAKHGHEDIKLPDMARKLGRSVSSISQFLRRNYGTGFKELLIAHRLKLAESFLRSHPEATVAEAAFAAGFQDQFYFSRLFRQRRGVPPGEYREQLRNSMQSK